MGAASLEYIFTTPPAQVAGTTDALMKALLAFNFDIDAPKIFARTDAYPESAMDFMTPPGVDDPKLAAFRDKGRKMIIYHGKADSGLSIDDTIRWWEKLDANLGGKADAKVRLFAVPGMTHCSDGVTLDKFDALTALTDWVEKGKGPDSIVSPSIQRIRGFRPPGARAAPARSARGRNMRTTGEAIRRVRRHSNARRREPQSARRYSTPTAQRTTKAPLCPFVLFVVNPSQPCSGSHDIGLRKIVALEEQRLQRQRRQGVGKTVAEVQSRGMASLAEAPPGAAGLVGLLCVDSDDLDASLVHPQIEFTAALFPSRDSMTIPASSTVAAEINRIEASAMRCSRVSASGSFSAMATIAEVSITISAEARSRRSR